MKKKFPKGFYWGAATAAYQVEGGIFNTDWAEAAVEGRVPPAGRSSDHYNRYEEDFDIAREIGHNAHRFSVEWARIEPEEGKFDTEAIAHYRNVLKALKKRNLRPYLTLWHFTQPIWFVRKGGFEKRQSAKIFARYAAHVARELGDLCDGISTMNEPNVFASNGWIWGVWPPFKCFSPLTGFGAKNFTDLFDMDAPCGIGPGIKYFQVMRNLARAHNAAYESIKSVRQEMEVSVVKHVIVYHSDKKLINRFKAWISNQHWTHTFMRRVIKRCDSIGLNYYIHQTYGESDRTYTKTDIGWDSYPEGIYHALMTLAPYKKPLFVSEAGVADEDDSERAEYIRKQVEAVWQAIQDGVDVRGHMYWSLLDNYEWAYGYEKRFGLVAIDYDTLERTIRPSAYSYKKICEANAVE